METRPRNGLSLCAGAGGLDMGLLLAEPQFHTRCFVEWEEYPRSAIIAAQRAGYFAPAPIWDDLTTFDATRFAGAIDTLLAGYPCQPFSMAGQRKGADDPRHLWPHVARVARELGDGLRWIILENVAGHVSLGAEAVLRELRDMGFTPAAGIFSAQEVGATHERQRWFCVAHREGRGLGVRGDAARQGRGGYVDRGDIAVADAANCVWGIHTRSRLQRQPAPDVGGPGGALENARRSEWRAVDARRNDTDRPEDGWDQGAGRLGEPSKNVDNAISDGCQQGRDWDYGWHVWQQPDAEGQPMAQPSCPIGEWSERQPAGGRGSANDSGQVADTEIPRPEGRRPDCYPQGRQKPHGSTGLSRGTGLFPPSPGDAGAWRSVIGASPDRAPSFARRDAAATALNFAAILTAQQAEALEPIICGVSSLSQLSTLVGKEAALVDQSEAQSRLRNVADGLAYRSRALRLLGNGVVPIQAAYAWRTLSAAHGIRSLDLGAASSGDATGVPDGDVLT